MLQLKKADGVSRPVLVANTHLKAGRDFAHLRAIEAYVCLHYIDTVMRCFPEAAVVFAGDFNSMPYTAVVDLIVDGRISSEHVDWFIGELLLCFSFKTAVND